MLQGIRLRGWVFWRLTDRKSIKLAATETDTETETETEKKHRVTSGDTSSEPIDEENVELNDFLAAPARGKRRGGGRREGE